uniref:Acetylornithine/succinyldiaminopimelate aminotransferase (ACOAT) (DapATase) (Succinyldiaminopimelate transferase) ) n=1 Tax=Ganoderma boninense TaxID=34458 RepID=A0A5K1JW78_9APHY|nr:Acetylornithine/succinyldiaminopimelate aminotransferase (ACOAT) (DapATase) (Succinyldiaminopimelate transferase) (EC (EC [Ganoderma boninense]
MVRVLLNSFLGVVALAALAQAAPTPLFGINFASGEESDAKPTAVSQNNITTDLQRPAQFSRAAYCPTDQVENWSCGSSCTALPNVKVLAAGGDDGEIPSFFIAQDPDQQTIVVAHQGTDPHKVLSIANDVEFKQVDANTTLFPQAGSGVQLHSGFQATQGRTADLVLATVKSALADSGFKKVLVTGHSLGAAVASLDAAMLRMALSEDVAVSSVVFGLPRVGNSEWADLLNKLIPDFAHVTNQNDPVPTVPPHFLDFEHPEGELHITQVNNSTGAATMVACPGSENQNCSAGNSVLDTSIQNHLGPYFNGISFGDKACQS